MATGDIDDVRGQLHVRVSITWVCCSVFLCKLQIGIDTHISFLCLHIIKIVCKIVNMTRQ